jgi:hypothetical protein
MRMINLIILSFHLLIWPILTQEVLLRRNLQRHLTIHNEKKYFFSESMKKLMHFKH